MIRVTDDGFDQFCASQAAALRRIARATRGECDLNDVRHAVARHLLISVSHAYRCRTDALNKTRIQPPVPTRMMEADFLPGPWRKRRYERAPRQFAFDFDDELPFNVS